MSHFIGIIRLSPPSYTKPLQAIRRGQLRHHAAPRSVPNVSLTIKSRNIKKLKRKWQLFDGLNKSCVKTLIRDLRRVVSSLSPSTVLT